MMVALNENNYSSPNLAISEELSEVLLTELSKDQKLSTTFLEEICRQALLLPSPISFTEELSNSEDTLEVISEIKHYVNANVAFHNSCFYSLVFF